MSAINKVKKYWNRKEDAAVYFKWVLGYTKPYIPQLAFLMIVDLISTLLSVSMAVIGKRMIDKASMGMVSDLWTIIIMYVFVIIGSEGLTMVSNMLSVVINEKFTFGIRKKVFRRILDTNWLDISKYHSGDLMTRLTSDVQSISEGISNTIPTIIRLIIELLVTFVT